MNMPDNNSQSPYLNHAFIEQMDARLNRLEAAQGKIKRAVTLTGSLALKAATASSVTDPNKLDDLNQDILRITLEIQSVLRSND
jgi:hypothetical protein